MWYLYIIECDNGSLYTGITTDVQRRFAAHKTGRGARYTRAFGAVRVRYTEQFRSQSRALRREAEIKKLSRTEKELLIAQPKKSRRKKQVKRNKARGIEE